MQKRLKIIKYYITNCSGCCFIDNALSKIQKLALSNDISTDIIYHNADIFGNLPDDVTKEHDLMPQIIFNYNDTKYILRGMLDLKTYISLIKDNKKEDKMFDIINRIAMWFVLGEMLRNNIGAKITEKENWIIDEIKSILKYIDAEASFLKKFKNE